MKTKFHFIKPVVAAIVGVQVRDRQAIDATVEMLLYRMSIMPPYLSWPMVILTVMFDIGTVLTTGRRFHALPVDRQAKRILAWKRSPFGIARDFVMFYEKMGTFIYFAGKEETVQR